MSIAKYRLNTFASLLVAIFVANWLLTPFLFARHEHVWCEEHQQFEHLHQHDSEHLQSKIQSGSYRSITASSCAKKSLRVLADRHSHSHEACHVLAQLIQTANAPFVPIDCNGVHAPNGHHLFVEHIVFSSVSKLSLAPKNSPPIA